VPPVEIQFELPPPLISSASPVYMEPTFGPQEQEDSRTPFIAGL